MKLESKQEELNKNKKVIVKAINKLIDLYANTYVFFLEKFIVFKWYSYYKSHHLEIELKKGFWPIFHWYTHKEFLSIKNKLIADNINKLKLKELISLVIDECEHCNFVIFGSKDKNTKLVFWVGDGEYVCEWNALDENKYLLKYTFAMLGVLNILGIHDNLNQKSKRLPYYETENLNDDISFKIYFKKYNNDTKNFISTMFKSVFKIKQSKITIQIG